jgi:predicted MFS family arabinose efflux permease
MNAVWQRFTAESRVLRPLCGASSIGYLPALTMPWLIGFLSRDLGYTGARAGTIVTVQLGCLAATTILLGSRIQRVNRRQAALAGAFAMIACGLALILNAPAVWLIAFLAVAGAGCGACNAAGSSLVSQAADPVRMASNCWGWIVIWQTAIWLATPLATEHLGGRGLGVVLAVGSLAMIPWLLHMPAGGDVAAAPKPSSGGAGAAATPSEPMTVPRALPLVYLPLMLGVAAFWLRDSLIWSLAETRGTQLAIDAAQLSRTLAIASILGIIGPVAANYLGNRGGRKARVIVALIAVALVMQLIATTDAASAYRLGFVFWTATSLFAWTYLTALAAEVDAAGRVVAMCSGVVFAASASGPLLGGILVDSGGGVGLSVAVATLSALTIAALLMVFNVAAKRGAP